MTRRRFLATSALGGLAIGLVAVAAGELVGESAELLVSVIVAVAGLAPFTYLLCIRPLAKRVQTALQAALDPAAGPPADASPIALDIADRWAQAACAQDARALGRLLADDFQATGAPDGRTYGRRVYTMTARRMGRIYPDLHATVDEVVARAGEPHVAWVRLTETGTPRRGAPLDVTWWERWTLDDGARQLRALHHIGVVRLG
jgi:hypothetical protein